MQNMHIGGVCMYVYTSVSRTPNVSYDNSSLKTMGMVTIRHLHSEPKERYCLGDNQLRAIIIAVQSN